MGVSKTPPGAFTERELQVLQLRADGKTMDEISHTLYISNSTVKWHFSAMMERMKAYSSFHLISIGFRQGVLR